MIAYKAFYEGMKGAGGFRYALGVTAEGTNLGLGRQGLHASFDPVFCLNFISSDRKGVYAEVDIDGDVDMGGPHAAWDGLDNRHVDCVTGSRLTPLRILSPEEMALRAVDYRIHRAEKYGILTKASDTRFGFVQGAGLRCVALADSDGSEATAVGEYASAFATAPGSRATVVMGSNTLAAALAPQSYARGPLVLLRDWDDLTSYRLVRNHTDSYCALRKGKVITL